MTARATTAHGNLLVGLLVAWAPLLLYLPWILGTRLGDWLAFLAPTLPWVGLVQLVWVVPAVIAFERFGQRRSTQGLLIGAGGTAAWNILAWLFIHILLDLVAAE